MNLAQSFEEWNHRVLLRYKKWPEINAFRPLKINRWLLLIVLFLGSIRVERTQNKAQTTKTQCTGGVISGKSGNNGCYKIQSSRHIKKLRDIFMEFFHWFLPPKIQVYRTGFIIANIQRNFNHLILRVHLVLLQA